MPRLFVAIRPPAPVCEALFALADHWSIDGARWQDEAQLHLTLRFVGEVDRHAAEDVAAALLSVRHPPIETVLSGLGSFARRGRADSLWIAVHPQSALTALHRKVDYALVEAGLPPEGRAYCPHVTLARLGRQAGSVDAPVAGGARVAVAPFTATAFDLIETTLTRDGSIYDTVARYPLMA